MSLLEIASTLKEELGAPGKKLKRFGYFSHSTDG